MCQQIPCLESDCLVCQKLRLNETHEFVSRLQDFESFLMDAMENYYYSQRDTMAEEAFDLPPGFRFHPTDEELITHYLSQKVLDNCFCSRAIGEVDLNKCEPWDLPCE